MARQLPSTVPGLVRPRWTPSLSVDLELITPMAGHTAAKATEPNVGTHAREASVANALRKWWRICHCTNYQSSADLFLAEAARFGSATKRGRVQVRTTTTRKGDVTEIGNRTRNGRVSRDWPGNWPTYALFPWESVDRPVFCEGMRFQVEICAPDDLVDEVHQACAAWVHLGGLGQRTRRGLGSLRRVSGDGLPALPQVLAAVTGMPPELMSGLPTNGNVLVKPGHTASLDASLKAWQECVNEMWYFRQAPDFARDKPAPGQRHPGQSYFPEADSVRAWAQIHDHPVEIFDGFPRANLGLPIIIEIKAARGVEVPPKSQINADGPGRSRFASPVITKAWWDASTRRYRPLIAVLTSPHVWEGGAVTLSTVDHGPPPTRPVPRREIELTAGERKKVWLSDRPIRVAFVDKCRERGFRPLEVQR